jgi:thiamine pyrophosphate-dependent acetolactate synthase large subunit-like protein
VDTTITHATSAATDGRSVPVHQVLAEDIKALGIDAVFGLMSDDTAVFVTSLDAIGVRFCGARHENQAVAMAKVTLPRPAGLASR